jgi:hypothetical protein
MLGSIGRRCPAGLAWPGGSWVTNCSTHLACADAWLDAQLRESARLHGAILRVAGCLPSRERGRSRDAGRAVPGRQRSGAARLRAATATAVISDMSELLLTSLAERADQVARLPDGEGAARQAPGEAAAFAPTRWREAVAGWGQLTTETTGLTAPRWPTPATWSCGWAGSRSPARSGRPRAPAGRRSGPSGGAGVG